jgi:endo-1,4-beta-xylanase
MCGILELMLLLCDMLNVVQTFEQCMEELCMKYEYMVILFLMVLFFSACTAPGTTPASSLYATVAPDVTLRDLAQSHKVLVGAAVNVGALSSDKTYADVLGKQFNVVTPENVMKFDATEPQQGVYDFTQGDALVAFAQAHHMQVRGHNFVWHQALPNWLVNGNFSRAQLMAILKDHITTVVKHYQGKVDMWDVVNEAVDDNGGSRDSIWSRGIGSDYIEMAFRWAHEADPQAHLFYNDYGAEGTGAKSDGVYKLLQDLKSRGVPIYGVGLQMHVRITESPQEQDVISNMQRLEKLGLKVQITEMDVSLRSYQEVQSGQGIPHDQQSLQPKLMEQARIYHDMLDACLKSGCEAFIMWGFTDRYSWLNGNALTPTHMDAPLIYDENYQRKLAFNGLVNAFRGEG